MASTKGKGFARIIRGVAVLLLAVIAALLILVSVLFSPAVTARLIAWGNADVFDYRKFPNRPLKTAQPTFRFRVQLDEARVRAIFERDPQIEALDEFLESTGTQAFIVIQDDTILYEGYFNETQHDSIVTSFSVAKSFTSALIGIAIQEGYIEDVNDSITEYIPELLERDARFSNVTIRDLLLMSSGIRYREVPPYGDDIRTYYHPDLRSQALEQTEIVDPPGEYFLYNNYHPLLLGLILERSTGMPVSLYLQEKLWKPLGMEFEGSWSLDSERSGFEKMESGINGRAIDFAKLGRLYLNRGNWQGTQIVPEAWVRESTEEDPTRRQASYYPDPYGRSFYTAAEGGYYKYMWYGFHRQDAENDFLAEGNKGQFVYVAPSKELIILRHGRRYGVRPEEWINIFYRFATTIEAG